MRTNKDKRLALLEDKVCYIMEIEWLIFSAAARLPSTTAPPTRTAPCRCQCTWPTTTPSCPCQGPIKGWASWSPPRSNRQISLLRRGLPDASTRRLLRGRRECCPPEHCSWMTNRSEADSGSSLSKWFNSLAGIEFSNHEIDAHDIWTTILVLNFVLRAHSFQKFEASIMTYEKVGTAYSLQPIFQSNEYEIITISRGEMVLRSIV